jgi:transposase
MTNHHRHTRRSTLAQSSILFIGMDVHTETIAVAAVAHDHGAEVAYLGTIVTVTTVAEIGALKRFDTPRAPMKFLGLIPSESSSGQRRQQGSMTKAGNTHARRALVVTPLPFS